MAFISGHFRNIAANSDSTGGSLLDQTGKSDLAGATGGWKGGVEGGAEAVKGVVSTTAVVLPPPWPQSAFLGPLGFAIAK